MSDINLNMLLRRCRDIPDQTVVRRGSLVFCVSKSSEAERERLKPLERNGLIGSAVEQHERVCEGCSDTDNDSNDKSGIKFVFKPDTDSLTALKNNVRVNQR